MESLICNDLQQAAQSILAQSFAIYRVKRETHESVKDAWKASHKFLSYIYSSSSDNSRKDEKHYSLSGNKIHQKENSNFYNEMEETFYEKYRRIENGNLFGLNQPSEAKLLYRAFYNESNQCEDDGKREEDDFVFNNLDCANKSNVNVLSANEQPWPDDYDNGALRQCSNDVASKFHDLLVQCANEIRVCLEDANEDNKKENNSPSSSSFERTSIHCSSTQATKKRKVQFQAVDSSTSKKPTTVKEDKYPTFSKISISNKNKETKINHNWKLLPCPLDYFLYHNMDPNAINCSEHVDRGILICISLTTVQGLEVLSSLTKQWICPEDLTVNDEDEFGCSEYLCILSGDQLLETMLRDFVHEETSENKCLELVNHWKKKHSGLSPCRHRVKRLSRLRLSISYELRIVL